MNISPALNQLSHNSAQFFFRAVDWFFTGEINIQLPRRFQPQPSHRLMKWRVPVHISRLNVRALVKKRSNRLNISMTRCYMQWSPSALKDRGR